MTTPSCTTKCEHCNGPCQLAADHGAGFTSTIPGDEGAHLCVRCNCTWSPTGHFHDGRHISRAVGSGVTK